MSLKYIVMAVFIFVLLHFALIPMGNAAMDKEIADRLNNIAYFGIPTEETNVGLLEYVKAPWNYACSMYFIMTRGISGNPLFSGSFQIIGWFVLAPIVAAWVFGMIITFFGIFQRALG